MATSFAEIKTMSVKNAVGRTDTNVIGGCPANIQVLVRAKGEAACGRCRVDAAQMGRGAKHPEPGSVHDSAHASEAGEAGRLVGTSAGRKH